MIKRFNPDFSLSISHELAYMRETPEGGYVAHGDYATLFSELESVKAERDALAANCGLYRESISKARRLINIDEMGDADDVLAKAERDLPATSAALAAIEARGVEKLADKLEAEIEQIMRGAFFYDDISSREAISKMVREFAAELREAK
ncbi:Uncharacterised protein [Serratia liquefaciens]|uniref:hypothetical protein n=1 Tax=Serratia liquefaciens TaxID=614 RepID=UPI002183E9EE|nr:hypothetical protein [Serratia liquefaciens]CAI2442614.1 Uncharacterised protein [Serratia liquefaciens]